MEGLGSGLGVCEDWELGGSGRIWVMRGWGRGIWAGVMRDLGLGVLGVLGRGLGLGGHGGLGVGCPVALGGGLGLGGLGAREWVS